MTEDGPAPWLGNLGLVECETPGYPASTQANDRDSDVTIWFGVEDSTGFWAKRSATQRFARPFFVVLRGTRPSDVAAWLRAQERPVEVVNVAGNRESQEPGMGDRTASFLIRLFRVLA